MIVEKRVENTHKWDVFYPRCGPRIVHRQAKHYGVEYGDFNRADLADRI